MSISESKEQEIDKLEMVCVCARVQAVIAGIVRHPMTKLINK